MDVGVSRAEVWSGQVVDAQFEIVGQGWHVGAVHVPYPQYGRYLCRSDRVIDHVIDNQLSK